MATRIIECSSRSTGLPVIPPVLREQAAMTASGTSAQSAAMGSGTEIVIVDSDEAIHVTTLATATANARKILAGGVAEFQLNEGDKIAIRTI